MQKIKFRKPAGDVPVHVARSVVTVPARHARDRNAVVQVPADKQPEDYIIRPLLERKKIIKINFVFCVLFL